MPKFLLLSSSHSNFFRYLNRYSLKTIDFSEESSSDDAIRLFLYARYPVSSLIGELDFVPSNSEDALSFSKIDSKIELPSMDMIIDTMSNNNYAYGGMYDFRNPVSYHEIKNIVPDFTPSKKKFYSLPNSFPNLVSSSLSKSLSK